jgi:hypothetical protein
MTKSVPWRPPCLQLLRRPMSVHVAFVPTAQVVSRLRDAGWSPVEASQQLVRLDNRQGFQKHVLRFQRREVQAVVGEYSPELVLLNSHVCSPAAPLSPGLPPMWVWAQAARLSVEFCQKAIPTPLSAVRRAVFCWVKDFTTPTINSTTSPIRQVTTRDAVML